MAPTWLSGVKAVAQAVAGALPALMLVIFAGALSLLGLACDQGRRNYALAYADRFIDLAAVLVGRPRKASTHQSPSLSPACSCGTWTNDLTSPPPPTPTPAGCSPAAVAASP